MQVKVPTHSTPSTMSALPTCLPSLPTQHRALPILRAMQTIQSSLRSISNMQAATPVKAASIPKQTTLMAPLFSTTSTTRLSEDRPTPKGVSTPTRLCTCLTMTGCRKSARHTTTRETRAFLQRTSKFRTRRKASRYRSR